MAFSVSWDETIPQGSEELSLGDDRIRQFKQAIRERLAVDHYFLQTEAGDTNIGYHNKVTLVAQGSDPAAVTGALILYMKNPASGQELYTRNAAGTIKQLTDGEKLRGDVFTRLGSIPSAAGVIPQANLGANSPTTATFLRGDGAWQNTLVGPIQINGTNSPLVFEGITSDSKLLTVTIIDPTSNHTLTLADANMDLRTQLVKAWVNFAGATGAINSAFNVTSVTRNSAGNFTANFTTSLNDANYAVSISMSSSGSANIVTLLAGSTRISTNDLGGSQIDPTTVTLIVIGN